MVTPGQAVQGLLDDYVADREKLLRNKIHVNQQRKAQDLEVEFINRMNTDLQNLPAGEFNAESYMSEFNERADSLMSEYEDPQSKVQFQGMFNNMRSQLGVKANTYELKSLKTLEDQSVSGWGDVAIQNVYQTYTAGGDVYDTLESTYNNATALMDGLSFEGQEKVNQKLGDYVVLTNNLRNQQLGEALLDDLISPEEYETAMDESQRMLNEVPLRGDVRIRANEQLLSQKARAVQTTTISAVKQIKENFDGYKLAYQQTGRLDPKFQKKLFKFAKTDPSLNRLVMELDVVKRSRPFYNALSNGDIRTMAGEITKARQERDNSEGLAYKMADGRYNQLVADYTSALEKREKNFADFYSTNPGISALKNEGLRRNDMSVYVRQLKALAKQQGIDPDTIELLGDNDVQVLQSTFKNLGKDPVTAARQIKNIERQWGKDAGLVFSQVWKDSTDPVVNAIRYVDTPNFPKIWEAANLTDDELKGYAFTAEGKKKFFDKYKSKLGDYYDSRMAQGDTNLGIRMNADAELGHRMSLMTGQSADRIASDLVNRDFDYVKGRGDRVNVRLPKTVSNQSRGDLLLRLKHPGLPKALLRSLKNKYGSEIPYDFERGLLNEADFEQITPSNKPVSTITGLDLPSSKPLSVAGKQRKIIDQTLMDNMKVVTSYDGDGIMIVLPGQVGEETLMDTPMTIDGEIIKFSLDELSKMRMPID